MKNQTKRRQFIKAGAIVGAGIAAAPQLFAQVAGSQPDIRVALVGCGGRGTGALGNFLDACKILNLNAKVVALADAYADRAAPVAEKYQVPEESVFIGFDAYKKAIASDCNFILLVTPPTFRPLHFAAAVEAGKNVFMEKPVAVDPPGCRSIIDSGKVAASKNLSVVVGTQRRHALGYLQNYAKIQADAIGEICGGAIYWDGVVPFTKERQEGWSNNEYLIRNWVNFNELSGDHIVEQHVHQIDVANWFIGRTPIAAIGYGGRMHRPSGNQFDFFSVDFDYGEGLHIHSQCRQIKGTYQRVGEIFKGAHGVCMGGGKLTGKDVSIPEISVDTDNQMVQEHVDLLRGFIEEKPLNDAQRIAENTLTGIMGRISAYTGQIIRWSDLINNENSPYYNLTLSPGPLDFEKGEVAVPEEVAPVVDHA